MENGQQDPAQQLASMLGESDWLVGTLRNRCASLNIEVQIRDARIADLEAQVKALSEAVSSEDQPEGE